MFSELKYNSAIVQEEESWAVQSAEHNRAQDWGVVEMIKKPSFHTGKQLQGEKIPEGKYDSVPVY